MLPRTALHRRQCTAWQLDLHAQRLQARRAALRQKLACQASSKQQEGALAGDSLKGARSVGKEDSYPEYETDADTELLPKRKPGNFPSVRPRTHVQKALAAVRLDGGDQPDVSEGVAFDPLRDGPLRYCGYANECGEAFAAWLPIGGVPLSYAVAIAYVLVDTYDKGHMAYLSAGVELADEGRQHPDLNLPRLTTLLSFERSLDTVVWQMLASVACPGYTIHSVVQIVEYALAKLQEKPAVLRALESAAAALHTPPDVFLALFDKTLPTMCGLAAIPFIVHPIDNGVHALLNLTLRPALKGYVCRNGQGKLAELQMCADEACVPPDA